MLGKKCSLEVIHYRMFINLTVSLHLTLEVLQLELHQRGVPMIRSTEFSQEQRSPLPS